MGPKAHYTKLLKDKISVSPGSKFQYRSAEAHNSVGNVADLTTRDRWFDPRLDQSGNDLGRILYRVLLKRTPGKHE